MLSREDIVAHRIVKIAGDSSSSDESFNFTDFIYVLDNNLTFRMPYDDESGEYLPLATLTHNHHALDWPKHTRQHLKKNLWDATITDVMIPRDHEERFPDSGVIKLSTGWFVSQLCGAPGGIVPSVDILKELGNSESMISVWQAMPSEGSS